jgi:predicted HicB family RNase H-like nuclease
MTRYTAFRCPEDLLEKAKAQARRERRSLSNYIITLIEKDVGDGQPPRKHPARAASRADHAAPGEQD